MSPMDEIEKTEYGTLIKSGYLEAFIGMSLEKEFSVKELFKIAENAECHNTGWPIGVTLTKNDLKPYAIESGIEAIIPSGYREMLDYWSLSKHGDFYFLRTYQEDDKTIKNRPPYKILWLDTQIWRISEILLYCTKLAKELAIDFSKEIYVYISFKGIKGRKLSINSPSRLWFDDDWYKCNSEVFNYEYKHSVDYLKLNYKDIIFEIGSELGAYFNFELKKDVSDSIVDEFLHTRK